MWYWPFLLAVLLILVLLNHLAGLNLLSWWGTVQTKPARQESVVSCVYAGWRNPGAVMVCHLETALTLWSLELLHFRNHPRKHFKVCPAIWDDHLLSCLLDVSSHLAQPVAHLCQTGPGEMLKKRRGSVRAQHYVQQKPVHKAFRLAVIHHFPLVSQIKGTSFSPAAAAV